VGSRVKGAVIGVAAIVAVGALVLSQTGAASPSADVARIEVPRLVPLASWTADTDNLVRVSGKLTLGGKPVAGARLRVDLFLLPSPTDADGRFTYLVDATRLAGHPVRVADASKATVGSSPVDEAAKASLAGAHASITVAYPVGGLKVSRSAGGNPVVTGKVARRDGTLPPPVSLYSYELTGTVTDDQGKPVVGARVSTRTADRDYWTISSFTDSSGRYTSLFTASSETQTDPVPFTVRVSKGDLSFEFLPDEYVWFERLRSARLDVRLPPKRYALAIPLPTSYPGAIYEGVVVGASVGGTPVRPVSATWLDASGGFRLELPKSAAGKPVTLWESKLRLFSRADAKAGGAIELRDWPAALTPDVAQDLVDLKP
jgi:hypothetical protein